MESEFIVLKEAGTALGPKESLEKLLSTLRGRGLSKVDSIVIVAKLGGLRLSEAKRLVHLSDAWKDHLESDERFHDDLEAALEDPA